MFRNPAGLDLFWCFCSVWSPRKHGWTGARLTGGRMDRCSDGWVGGWLDERTDGWLAGWMVGWMDRCLDGWVGNSRKSSDNTSAQITFSIILVWFPFVNDVIFPTNRQMADRSLWWTTSNSVLFELTNNLLNALINVNAGQQWRPEGSSGAIFVPLILDTILSKIQPLHSQDCISQFW